MRKISLVAAIALLLAGILGFVLGSPLFGVLDVNALHNIVHLASGAIAFVAWTQGIGAVRTCGRILGLAYFAFALAGFAMPEMFGLMHVNMPDNFLHLVVAAVFLYVGFVAPPS